MDLRRSDTGASLIGVLIALAIIVLLVFVSARIYMGGRQDIDPETERVMQESGIQTHSDGAVLNSAKKKIAEQENLIQSRGNKIDEIN